MTDTKYRFAAVATDLVIAAIKNNALHILTIDMQKDPYKGLKALPGSLVKPEESLDGAANRLLGGNNKNIHLEQVYTFGRPDRDPFGRVVSTAYLVLIPRTMMETVRESVQKSTGKPAHWLNMKDAARQGKAYDHDQILETAMDRLRAKLQYTNIVQALMPEEFTITELRKAYEAILGKPLDKRNFISRLNNYHLVEETGAREEAKNHRPAKKYRFTTKAYIYLSRFF